MRLPGILCFMVLITFSCCKDDDELDEVPNWLLAKIEQLENDSFPGWAIYEYKWNSSLFFHIVNPVSSCAFCEFYDYNGNKYEWTSDSFDDFQKNAVLLGTVWEEGF